MYHASLEHKCDADPICNEQREKQRINMHIAGTHLALNRRKLFVIRGRLKGGREMPFDGRLSVLSVSSLSRSSEGMTCWRSLPKSISPQKTTWFRRLTYFEKSLSCMDHPDCPSLSDDWPACRSPGMWDFALSVLDCDELSISNETTGIASSRLTTASGV